MRSVSIIGVGLSKFGEQWDKGADDLMVAAISLNLSGLVGGMSGFTLKPNYG